VSFRVQLSGNEVKMVGKKRALIRIREEGVGIIWDRLKRSYPGKIVRREHVICSSCRWEKSTVSQVCGGGKEKAKSFSYESGASRRESGIKKDDARTWERGAGEKFFYEKEKGERHFKNEAVWGRSTDSS